MLVRALMLTVRVEDHHWRTWLFIQHHGVLMMLDRLTTSVTRDEGKVIAINDLNGEHAVKSRLEASSAAIAQINANASDQIRGIAESRDTQLVNLSDILRRNTVMPGEAVGGVVKFKGSDLKSGKPFSLVATVNGESHEFLFEVGK